MLRKFVIGNTILVTGAYMVTRMYLDSKTQDIYKNSAAFGLAMSTLRSHAGAVHFLGEHIESGRLSIVNEKKDNDFTTYHVKVAVQGEKTSGIMHFWLRREGDADYPDLGRIELQIQNIKNILLIKAEDKHLEAPAQNSPS